MSEDLLSKKERDRLENELQRILLEASKFSSKEVKQYWDKLSSQKKDELKRGAKVLRIDKMALARVSLVGHRRKETMKTSGAE